MTYKLLQTNFERELLFCLIFNMKKGKLSTKRAQEVAQEFLKILKLEESAEGFMKALSKKAEYYPEIREAFLKVAVEYEEENVKERLLEVRTLLKGGLN